MNRKDYINKIEEIIVVSGSKVKSGSWNLNFLKNPHTAKLCQVAEATDEDGTELAMPVHAHEHSQELFYQLEGETYFTDGTVIHPGEFKLIPVGTPHSAILRTGGKCIIIVHPVEPAYPMGDS